MTFARNIKKIEIEDLVNLEKNGKTASRIPTLIKFLKMDIAFEVKTLEGIMKGRKGDYLVKGNFGEVYVIRKHIFKKNYEVV